MRKYISVSRRSFLSTDYNQNCCTFSIWIWNQKKIHKSYNKIKTSILKIQGHLVSQFFHKTVDLQSTFLHWNLWKNYLFYFIANKHFKGNAIQKITGYPRQLQNSQLLTLNPCIAPELLETLPKLKKVKVTKFRDIFGPRLLTSDEIAPVQIAFLKNYSNFAS